MNYKTFNVLTALNAGAGTADAQAVDELIRAGLYDGISVTEQGLAFLNAHRVDNAIILAAGISSRFVPIAFDKPKGLLEVNGEVLIERQIRQLRECGIQEIIIVVGYKKEQFEYLKDKYSCILVETDDYLFRNNHASVYATRSYLKNSIITSSDLYFSKNLFQQYAYDSYYCSVFIRGDTDERGLVIDNDDRIIETYYHCHDIWVSLGYAFFSKRFSEKYIEIVSRVFDDPKTHNKFWADIQDEYLSDLYMYIKRCNAEDIHEFDSLKELYDFQEDFRGVKFSKTLSFICSVMNCDEKELYQFKPVCMKGILRICSFRYAKELYYFCQYAEAFIDSREFCKTLPALRFKVIGLDLVKNQAVLKIQEEYND
jgi:CTP:phosphocholine cytidylyltransferase-like protein